MVRERGGRPSGRGSGAETRGRDAPGPPDERRAGDEARPRSAVRKRPLPEKKSPHVLVVDDDVAVLFAVKQTLAPAGMEVEVAESGEEAVARCRRRMPDLMLLDVVMPGEDGFQVCAKLKRVSAEDLKDTLRSNKAPTPKVPVIFLTARGQLADVKHALDVGGDGYIVKPFKPEHLLAKVRSFLDPAVFLL